MWEGEEFEERSRGVTTEIRGDQGIVSWLLKQLQLYLIKGAIIGRSWGRDFRQSGEWVWVIEENNWWVEGSRKECD